MKKNSYNYIGLFKILMIIIISIFAWANMEKVDETVYTNGVYLNQVYGYHSDILVKVTVQNNRIFRIEVLSHEEPDILADIVFDELPPKIIKYNKTSVDIVSGATYTSRSLLEAIDKALEEALEEAHK